MGPKIENSSLEMGLDEVQDCSEPDQTLLRGTNGRKATNFLQKKHIVSCSKNSKERNWGLLGSRFARRSLSTNCSRHLKLSISSGFKTVWYCRLLFELSVSLQLPIDTIISLPNPSRPAPIDSLVSLQTNTNTPHQSLSWYVISSLYGLIDFHLLLISSMYGRPRSDF